MVRWMNTTRLRVVTVIILLKRASFNLASIFSALIVRCNNHYLSWLKEMNGFQSTTISRCQLVNKISILNKPNRKWHVAALVCNLRFQHRRVMTSRLSQSFSFLRSLVQMPYLKIYLHWVMRLRQLVGGSTGPGCSLLQFHCEDFFFQITETTFPPGECAIYRCVYVWWSLIATYFVALHFV